MAMILLVEDDPNECVLYERELQRDGYKVQVVRGGAEAIAVCEGSRPDLVVLDISMPGMDGIDVMNRLRCKDNKLPIILNTAYASYKDDFRAWAADAYVVKSSSLHELKQTIQHVLEERQQPA